MKLAVNFWQIVLKSNRNVLPLLLSIFILTGAVVAANDASAPAGAANIETSSVSTNPAVVPSATFKRLWIDYDVTENGVKGMRIHTSFEVRDMKGMAGYLALYFLHRDGTPLKDNNGEYDSVDGTVMAHFEITPAYNPVTVYDDLDIFMPYDELDLPDGEHKLSVRANVIYKKGGNIQNGLLTTYDFVYTQGGTPDATFNRLWVDYDVNEGGQRGMRIHVNFRVTDMKGVDGRLAIYFQTKEGDYLLTTNSNYRSKDKDRIGQVVVYYDIKPGYETTDYKDASVFIPYSVLNLPRGTHDLQMDVDLVYANGNLIKHLEMHDFWFEK